MDTQPEAQTEFSLLSPEASVNNKLAVGPMAAV